MDLCRKYSLTRCSYAQGGDWDRRNRLKVYEALYHMSARNFKDAAKLFLEAVPTFSSNELFSYEHLIFYTVITCMLSKFKVYWLHV